MYPPHPLSYYEIIEQPLHWLIGWLEIIPKGHTILALFLSHMLEVSLIKVLVPPPPQLPQMTWNVLQNLEMGLEMMWCAYYQILKKGVAILACHAHFIQSENQKINFASEWVKFSLFVSR